MPSPNPRRAVPLLLTLLPIQHFPFIHHRPTSPPTALAFSPPIPSISSARTRGTPRGSTPTNVSTQPTTLSPPTQSLRQLTRIEQYSRLPIWPIWSGILLFLTSRLLGAAPASHLEDLLGGRVCPNFFDDAAQTSPFLLLVHHRHSFSGLDPVRFLQRLVFPEGFPSHPHRGFVTVTYCLRGGMVHRDSLGIKQVYGAEERHGGMHVQWLTAGAGMQHEEMWDVGRGEWWWSDQELFQIWVNLPGECKMVTPKVELLRRHVVGKGDEGSIPEGCTPVVEREDGVVTTVVCGEHDGIRSSVDCPTNVSILRVQFTQHSSKKTVWKYALPKKHETAILYVRQGAVLVGSELIPAHHTGFLSSEGEALIIECEGEADVLLLSGEPLREPVVSKGSMVMNTEQEIQEAYLDYQRGYMGLPWSEKLSDSDWREHVKRYPSRY